MSEEEEHSGNELWAAQFNRLPPEQTALWEVDIARGGGWTVSKHTEDEYVEFFLVYRQEAEDLKDRLNDLEAGAALADEMANGLREERYSLFGPSVGSPPIAYYRDWLARYDALTQGAEEVGR